jgi:hypothetical protein
MTAPGITRMDRTAFILDRLPGEYSMEHFWAMPDGTALHTLASMLGEGSQAFLFLDMAFGYPGDFRHDYVWHEQFAARLDAAWGTESAPRILVEYGFGFKLHGGVLDDNTSERLFGTQTGDVDWGGRPAVPIPIRMYGCEYWNQKPDSDYTGALCRAIIAELNGKALMLDPSPAHFDARMNMWLQRAGATSSVYDQVVHIERWQDGMPIIDSVTTVPRAEVRA